MQCACSVCFVSNLLMGLIRIWKMGLRQLHIPLGNIKSDGGSVYAIWLLLRACACFGFYTLAGYAFASGNGAKSLAVWQSVVVAANSSALFVLLFCFHRCCQVYTVLAACRKDLVYACTTLLLYLRHYMGSLTRCMLYSLCWTRRSFVCCTRLLRHYQQHKYILLASGARLVPWHCGVDEMFAEMFVDRSWAFYFVLPSWLLCVAAHACGLLLGAAGGLADWLTLGLSSCIHVVCSFCVVPALLCSW